MKVLTIGDTVMGLPFRETLVLPNGKAVVAEDTQEPVSDEYYYIVPDKCTECKGFHDEPQCAAVCPVDCCVPDEENVETEEVLLSQATLYAPRIIISYESRNCRIAQRGKIHPF